MSEPAAQVAILGMAETTQGAVKRGFAKHLHRFRIALVGTEDHRAHLVVIHQPADPLRVAVPHQQAELLGADPGLAINHHAVQRTVVAHQQQGDMAFFHKGLQSAVCVAWKIEARAAHLHAGDGAALHPGGHGGNSVHGSEGFLAAGEGVTAVEVDDTFAV